jgi:hypothetical protein
MVIQIYNLLNQYKKDRASNDRVYAKKDAAEKASLLPELIAKQRPAEMRKREEERKQLMEETLAKVERELQKVDAWVEYLTGEVNVDALSEVRALEGVELTPYQVQQLQLRYSTNYYALAAFCEQQNRSRGPLEKLECPPPEAFLKAAQQIKNEVVYVLKNYSEDTGRIIDAGQRNANIAIKLIDSNWGKYFDSFTCSYFSEADLDTPAPLTSSQKRIVDGIFTGCKDSYDRALKAEEAADKGYADLILRSDYAHLLKHYQDEEKPVLSEEGKKMLYGQVAIEAFSENGSDSTDKKLSEVAEQPYDVGQAAKKVIGEAIEELNHPTA